jgi:hypothetical protein
MAAAYVAWLLLALHAHPGYIAASLGSTLGFAVLALGVRWLLSPRRLSGRARTMWALSTVGVIHATLAVTSALLQLGSFRDHLAAYCARLGSLPPSCWLPPSTALRLLTAQLLTSSGYYALSIAARVHQRAQGRHPTSLCSQAVVLILFTLALRRGATSLSAPVQPPLVFQAGLSVAQLRRLLTLGLLGELHTAAVLVRDLLVVAGYLQAAPADAEILQVSWRWCCVRGWLAFGVSARVCVGLAGVCAHLG